MNEENGTESSRCRILGVLDSTFRSLDGAFLTDFKKGGGSQFEFFMYVHSQLRRSSTDFYDYFF